MAVTIQIEVFWVTSPWGWRQHQLLKCWYPTTTQKTLTWNNTTVKISKFAFSFLFHGNKLGLLQAGIWNLVWWQPINSNILYTMTTTNMARMRTRNSR